MDLSRMASIMGPMSKKIMVLAALAVALTGCVAAPGDGTRPGILVPSTSASAPATPSDAASTIGSTDGCTPGGSDIRVAAGATCELSGERVTGNIEVGRGATLVANDVIVDGNIDGEGHASITVSGGVVNGNIELERGGDATVSGVRIDGNLDAEGNVGALSFTGNTIDGNLECESNNPAPTGGDNRVNGDKEGQCAGL